MSLLIENLVRDRMRQARREADELRRDNRQKELIRRRRVSDAR